MDLIIKELKGTPTSTPRPAYCMCAIGTVGGTVGHRLAFAALGR
jgi:hypothetical protein